MCRSWNPGCCSCCSDMYCTRHLSLNYSFIKHEVRSPYPLSGMNTISFLEKLQPVRKRNTQVVIGECGRYHKIGFPGMLGRDGGWILGQRVWGSPELICGVNKINIFLQGCWSGSPWISLKPALCCPRAASSGVDAWVSASADLKPTEIIPV